MFAEDKGNVLANFGICILFVWALGFISFVVLHHLHIELSRYPALVAMLAGVPGALGAFSFGFISSIRKPRKRGLLVILLSALVFVVTFGVLYLPVIT